MNKGNMVYGYKVVIGFVALYYITRAIDSFQNFVNATEISMN